MDCRYRELAIRWTVCAALGVLVGCTSTDTGRQQEAPHKEAVRQAPAVPTKQETFALRQVSAEQATGLPKKLGVSQVATLPADANGAVRLVVTGSSHQIEIAHVVLDLADVNEVGRVSPQPQQQAAEPNKTSLATAEAAVVRPATTAAAPVAAAEMGQPPAASTEPDAAARDSGPAQPPLRGVLRPSQRPAKASPATGPASVAIPDGDQMLELALPEKTDLTQLLELAGTYLNLDYLYDAEKLKGQTVTLKLHGKLQGKVKVKDLYSLLETVLKFKVLVNDNEKGTIKTTETTYLTKKSSMPVTSGTAGQHNSLIETAVDYQGYDAGVSLEITPHIGEKDLLRLEITTNRSDFGTISGDKPPDKTGSDLSTVVTVPDQSTIILGGMLKLNQTKGGKKVPILGDLPFVGLLFRGVSNTDIQSKLYVFVRAEILQPAKLAGAASKDLERISEQNRSSFERHEQEFQDYQTVPGVKPEPTSPARVLQAQ